jgi:hypothetical protein
MPEIALNPPPFNPRTRGGLGGCGEPTGRVGTARGADAALGPPRAAARPGGPHAGGSGGGAPPAVARHPVAAGPSRHAGAHPVDRRADRSGAPVGAAPGARTGAWMGGRGGRRHARAHADGGPAGGGVGRRPCGTVGAARRASARAGGCRVGCPAPVGRGGRPPKYVDGRGRAPRSGDGPGCGGLAGTGGGAGHAVDGGRRHADRRCSTAGGSATPPHAGGTGGVRAPPRRRWSGTAQRGNRLLRRGAGRRLRWVLAHGRCWVRVWVRPEPLPKSGDSITMHLDDPSQCLKSP